MTAPIQQDNNFTVFIRLPFPRGDFVDPPPASCGPRKFKSDLQRLPLTGNQVLWNAAKDQALWDILSRTPRGDDVDCICQPHSTKWLIFIRILLTIS